MRDSQIRYIFVGFFFLVLFGYLFFVLYKLQLVSHSQYYQIRKQQNEFVNKESKRGTIYGTLKNGELVPLAEDEDYHTEHLCNALNIKIVENMDEAIVHIAEYG